LRGRVVEGGNKGGKELKQGQGVESGDGRKVEGRGRKVRGRGQGRALGVLDVRRRGMQRVGVLIEGGSE